MKTPDVRCNVIVSTPLKLKLQAPVWPLRDSGWWFLPLIYFPGKTSLSRTSKLMIENTTRALHALIPEPKPRTLRACLLRSCTDPHTVAHHGSAYTGLLGCGVSKENLEFRAWDPSFHFIFQFLFHLILHYRALNPIVLVWGFMSQGTSSRELEICTPSSEPDCPKRHTQHSKQAVNVCLGQRNSMV